MPGDLNSTAVGHRPGLVWDRPLAFNPMPPQPSAARNGRPMPARATPWVTNPRSRGAAVLSRSGAAWRRTANSPESFALGDGRRVGTPALQRQRRGLIPAWGNAPGDGSEMGQGLKARSIPPPVRHYHVTSINANAWIAPLALGDLLGQFHGALPHAGMTAGRWPSTRCPDAFRSPERATHASYTPALQGRGCPQPQRCRMEKDCELSRVFRAGGRAAGGDTRAPENSWLSACDKLLRCGQLVY